MQGLMRERIAYLFQHGIARAAWVGGWVFGCCGLNVSEDFGVGKEGGLGVEDLGEGGGLVMRGERRAIKG